MTPDALAVRFAEVRPRLLSVATRLLGSPTDAEDAVQESWLRLERAPADEIDNLDAWLTTVVSRLCLDELKSARRRRERAWHVEPWLPEVPTDAPGPEQQAVDSAEVGTALGVMLDRLTPAERVAVVLMEVFGMGYAELAAILDRRQDATRQLVSRARAKLRRSRDDAAERAQQREIVNTWLRAVTQGDLRTILGVLAEDAVLAAHWADRLDLVDGAAAIGENATRSAQLAANSVLIRVDGDPAVAAIIRGRVISLMTFDLEGDTIIGFDVLLDPDRLAPLRDRIATG